MRRKRKVAPYLATIHDHQISSPLSSAGPSRRSRDPERLTSQESEADRHLVHDRYKDLTELEKVFRGCRW